MGKKDIYTLLIVDDEHASREFIRNIIEMKLSGIKIIGEAENGEEALTFIEKNGEPDIIVSDIRMPLMDGVEFVQTLRERGVNSEVVILSGYEEFEYARSLFRCGVVDYLIKPVNIKQFITVMEGIKRNLTESANIEKEEYFFNILSTGKSNIDIGSISQLKLAIIRRGGPATSTKINSNRLYLSSRDDVVILSGRDENEFIAVALSPSITRSALLTFLTESMGLKEHNYKTYGVIKESIDINTLKENVEDMFWVLDRRIRLEESTQVDFSKEFKEYDLWDIKIEGKIKNSLIDQSYKDLQSTFYMILEECRVKQIPIVSIQILLRRYLESIQSFVFSNSSEPKIDIYERLTKIVSEVNEYQTLKAQVWDLVKLTARIDKDEYIENIPVFFRDICHFIEQHYRENISINDISEEFGLSASYIGKLFKKYHSCTFTEFHRSYRIKAACREIHNNPDKSIQEIARTCGFDDVYYFSKVFKKELNLTPTQYRKSI